MDKEALYACASAYATRKIVAAGSGAYSDSEQTEVITLLSQFFKNPNQLVTEASIKARVARIDAMATPGPANVLFAEALEHALAVVQKTQKADRAASR